MELRSAAILFAKSISGGALIERIFLLGAEPLNLPPLAPQVCRE
jgi:hypothetical protein